MDGSLGLVEYRASYGAKNLSSSSSLITCKKFPSRSAYDMADGAEPVCAASVAQKCQSLKVDQNEQQTPPWPKVAFSK